MDRGSFFYAADGTLRVRPFGEEAHDARGHEWREAGLALNPSLGDPTLTRFRVAAVHRLAAAARGAVAPVVARHLSSMSRDTTTVETMGLEPTTPCLQSRCSSQLSYVPG